MAAEPPRFVLDAFVAAKWYLPDEADTEAAASILTDFASGRIRLLAPDQIRYEVPSAIRNTVRTGRLSPEDARDAITDFLAWHLPTVASDELVIAAYDQAVRFGCSLYDGLYLALAAATESPLIYADGRLRNSLGGRFPLALWLTDYQPRGAAEGRPATGG